MLASVLAVCMATSVGIGDREARNGVAFELGGAGGLYSFSYERFVGDDLSLRVGLGALSLDSHDFWYVAVPVSASYLLSLGNHALELGGGFTVIRVYGDIDLFSDDETDGPERSETNVVLGALAGYRYAPRDGGFTFRLAATPFVRFDFPFVESGIWFGALFGYLF